MSTCNYSNSILASGLNGYPGGLSSQTSLASSSATTRHSLSKELMQKLRSMTETIKMLSDENEMLKRENERIKDEEEGVYTVIKHEVGKIGGGASTTNKNSSLGLAKKISGTGVGVANKSLLPQTSRLPNSDGGYDDMNKTELVSLTKAYDQKVKALSDEIQTLQKEILRQTKEHNAVRFETNMDEEDGKDKLQMYSTGIKNDTGASKDKYKTLARRLKEERNQYRETCEEKQ